MLRIIFFGTPEFVRPVIEIVHTTHALLAIVTTPDQTHKHTTYPPATKKIGEELGIPVIQFETFSKAVESQLIDLQPDLFVVAAYGKIIPQRILDIPKLGAINLHPSLLPEYRGPSPIQATILSGDTETGITVIQMDKEMDHGPILAQEKVSLYGNETLQMLHDVLFQKGADLLPQVIEQLHAGTIKPIQQDDSQATFCKQITRDDGFLDPDHPPSKEQIDRMIRAYYPWPGVWSKVTVKNEEVRIKLFPNNEIQLEGKKRMTLKDFLNGYPELRELLQNFF